MSRLYFVTGLSVKMYEGVHLCNKQSPSINAATFNSFQSLWYITTAYHYYI